MRDEATKNLTGDDSLEAFEELLQINHCQEATEVQEKQCQGLETQVESEERFWDEVERVTGKEYSLEQRRDSGSLSSVVIGQVFDNIYGKPGALIQPSHSLLSGSLIKNRDLSDYIPTQHGILNSVLRDSAVRSFEVVSRYTSENTRRAFNGDIIYWQAWLSAIGFDFRSDRITVDIIQHFIIEHVEGLNPDVDRKLVEQAYKSKLGTHSLETVKRRIASLSVCLDLDKKENPCRDKEVNLLLKKLTQMYGGKNRKKKAITKNILEDMLLTCGRRLIDVRDKAVLFFAFSSGGRRRCEVTDADMANLTETEEGDYLYNLRKSKTNQSGADDYKPVKGRAAKALRDWLEASGVKEGGIFRSVGKSGDIRGSLSGNDIRRIVMKRAKLAGYDETQFSAHSLRRGFVTEGGRQGKSIFDIMKMTSHKNVDTAMKYYEAGSAINNSCAVLVG